MITISAFSDWKCGALTDEQFYSLTARENRRDRDLYEESLRDYKGTCLNCKHSNNKEVEIEGNPFTWCRKYKYHFASNDVCHEWEDKEE